MASTSPRRQEILKSLGVPFEVVASNYEEDMTLKMSPSDLVIYLACGKAQEVARRIEDSLVIGADTAVVYNENVIGKPKNESEAKKTLQNLSGGTHSVLSGVSIVDSSNGRHTEFFAQTQVTFRTLTEYEIDSYIVREDVLSLAGSFAVQKLGALFIKKIEGDYTNVVGLPVALLYTHMKEFGVDFFTY